MKAKPASKKSNKAKAKAKAKKENSVRNRIIQRILEGEVVSTAMAKTLVVKVRKMKIVPKYRKRVFFYKKYKVHAPEGKFSIGDKVLFRTSRPISKEKSWVVVRKVD